MKKRTLAAIILSVALATVATTAYAASYEGKIWTGKPTIFGIGYYCTAAQNNSGGNQDSHFQWAKTYLYYGSVIEDSYSGQNKRVVASSGSTHPKKGEGAYGESGFIAKGSFKSTAWD